MFLFNRKVVQTLAMAFIRWWLLIEGQLPSNEIRYIHFKPQEDHVQHSMYITNIYLVFIYIVTYMYV